MSGFREVARNIVSNYLNAGVKNGTHIEVARKITVLNLFALVGFTITLLLGIRAAFNAEWPLAASLAIAFFLFLFSHIYVRISKSEKAYLLGSTLLQLVLITLCLYLVYGGGTNNTGPLWVYLVPPVVMFFSGLKRGLMTVAGFLIAYCVIVFYPDNQINAVAYSYEFKTRLLYSFATLTFLAGFYEYSRQLSYQKLNTLTKELEKQATLDPLTTLLNRRGMRERIEYEMARSKRIQKNVSILLADVDYFKQINDKYGHDIGDAVLMSMAEMFTGSIRKQDSIARWGGEEFLFLLPDTNLDQAVQLAMKIRSLVESQPFQYGQVSLHTSLSIGVAEVEDSKNVRQAIAIADARLYIAKTQGRNTVVFSDVPAGDV